MQSAVRSKVKLPRLKSRSYLARTSCVVRSKAKPHRLFRMPVPFPLTVYRSCPYYAFL